MNPRTRIVGTYLRLVTDLGKLMARAERKLSPARYRWLDQRAARFVESLSQVQQAHVQLVDEIRQLLGESDPPPPPHSSPPSSRPSSRRSNLPSASRRPPGTLHRFTLHPPRRNKKR